MDKVADLLGKLADKLGVTVQYLWPLLVKKTVVDWWADLAVFFALFAVFTTTTFLTRKWVEEDPDRFPLTAGLIVASLFSFIGFMVVLSNVASVIVPEAATISNLINSLKK